jgi:spermidine synthase
MARHIQLYSALFLTSFCIMVVEIVAGRILAPFLGVSLYTWTSIIGVVLAGISIGARLGGIVADRFPRFSTLGWILLFSSITSLFVPPVADLLGSTYFFGNLMARTLFVATLIFLAPSCLLGMVSPVAVKLALVDIENTGSIAGKMYAISTTGSIIGTFAAGFWLISFLGTRNLLFFMGVLLLLAGLFFLTLGRTAKLVLVVISIAAVWAIHYYLIDPRLSPDVAFFKESNYYTIKVIRNQTGDENPMVTLYLDQLTHSCSDLNDPLKLQYRYIRSYKEILQWKLGNKKDFVTLSLGGGGYTFPRFLEAVYPKSRIDVVEIDPLVTRTAQQYMGLPFSPRIRTYNEDGRWFVMNAKGTSLYDFIFLDAFNDLSIPYHLTTKEFAAALKKLLKKNGLLVVNVIDRFERGSFLPAYIRTLDEVFGNEMVHLVTLGNVDPKGVDNRVVIANMDERAARALTARLTASNPDNRISYVMPSDQLEGYLTAFNPPILTDDFAPVDNLTAKNFR